MRFLFDAHHLGQHQTGNETWVRNVVRGLEELRGDDTVEYAVTSSGLDEIHRLASGRPHLLPGNTLQRLVITVPRIARRTGSDAVFATYTVPLTTTPVVLAVHDVSAWHPGAGEWLPLHTRLQYRTSVGLSVRRAAHVLALCDGARRDLIDKLGARPDRVSVASPAVDADLARLLRRTPRGGGRPVFRVLAVGNVVPRKNLVVLARAVKACRDAGREMELRIVGSVPRDSQGLADKISDVLGPNVHMTGYVTQAQLATEYGAGDVLGFPSLLEGFGIPVIEAMAAGLPVVVSDASVLPEVAGDAALVRGAHDVAGWRDAILRLHDDETLRDDLRRRGWRRAAQFSWNDTAAVLLDRLRAATEVGRFKR